MTQNVAPEIFYFNQLCNYWQVWSIKAACELGLADHFNDGPKSAAEIAASAGLNPEALFRLLRALSDCGVFEQTAPGVFAHTERSQLLRSDLPQSMKWMVLSEFGPERVPAWMNLPASIQTGKIAFDEVYGGKDVWSYYREHPEQGDRFARWMTASSHAVAQAIHEVFDFSRYKTVVDVAGGQGAFLTSILERNPQLRGILYDLPPVIAQAPAHPRIEAVAGDIFTTVPKGGDLYILKWIIHDWEEAKAIQVLKNVHRAMQPGCTLILIEGLVSETNSQPGPDMIKWMDMNMMVMTGGRERTEAEYRRLLTDGGFQLDRVIPTASIATLLVSSAV